MRRKLSVQITALALLSALPAPAGSADLACADVQLVCSGFEPNWQFTLQGSSLSFIDPENPNWETAPLAVSACAAQESSAEWRITTPAPLSLAADIVEESCTQPNDEVWPFSVNASFTQGVEGSNPTAVSGTGCCRRP